MACCATIISVFFINRFLTHYKTISIVKKSFDQKKEYDHLMQTVLKLRLALNNTANIIEENERLRKMLDLDKKNEDVYLSSQVIAQSPFDWEKRVKIDKGKKDGIKEGNYVVDHNGFLLGKIDSVENKSAWVLLLSDSDFKISVICNEERYLFKGDSKISGSLLYVPYDDKISIGDKIVIRDNSLRFPNIPVAEVASVVQDRNFLTAEVKVVLAADPQDVSLVFVVGAKE